MVEESGKIKRVVYSCSGCSSAAQLANNLALRLDRAGLARMSCIAGVGGKVKPLVDQALKSDYIVTIDGCALECCKACLNGIGVKANHAIVLSDLGVKKKMGEDFDPADGDAVYEELRALLKASEKANNRGG